MNNIPTGTVSFLFTDIEGSTRMWETRPDEISVDLERHDALLRNAIESNGGYVFKTVGDAFCAAFSTPSAAVMASVEAQCALRGESWHVSTGIRVRMGVHAGEVAERDLDYFGATVNRVARLTSAAHGGQVLVSSTVEDLLRETLPPEIALRDLGMHRLKDLTLPQRVFQLIHPDLRTEFPLINSIDSRLNNLPSQSTPLVGREKELSECDSLLANDDVRILTIIGTGGTGKTRIAVQAAANSIDRFRNGAFFVDLSAFTDIDGVLRQMARILGVVESTEDETSLEELVSDFFVTKEILLLLDNFEQALEAASLVSGLVSKCAGLKVLVTSREPLRIRGERQFIVQPLGLPDDAKDGSYDSLMHYDAVRLFIDRALAADASFSVTNESAPAVAEICISLDGLPLAIELAAARIRILSPDSILSRLGARLKLLTGGPRDSPRRHQNLRSTIEWSYDLLEDDERTVFARLSVFAGGCSSETAEAVFGELDEGNEADFLEFLGSLTEKSLLCVDHSRDEPRFVMLQTIREYAAERLQSRSDAEEIKRRYIELFLHLAEKAEPEFFGKKQAEWMARIDDEYDNLRHCLKILENDHEYDRGLRMAKALGWYWFRRGRYNEGRNHLERFLEAAGDRAEAGIRARAYLYSGIIRYISPGFSDPATTDIFHHALICARVARSKADEAMALSGLSQGALTSIARPEKTLEKVIEYAENGLQTARESEDPWTIALCTWASLGFPRQDLDMETIEQRFATGFENADMTGDPFVISRLTLSMAWALEVQERFDESLTWYRKYATLAKEIGETWMECEAHVYPGRVYLSLGKIEKAREEVMTSLAMAADAGARMFIINSMWLLGRIELDEKNIQRGVRLFAGASKLNRASVAEPGPQLMEFFDKLMPRDAWINEWRIGNRLAESEIVEFAMSSSDRSLH